MVYSKFYCKPSAGSIHMTLQGHAGSAPKGSDLICASLTMLAYTLAQAVQFLYEQGALKKKPRIWLGDGEATIIATPKEEAFAQVLQSYWVAQCGCYVLARNYPQYVTLAPIQYEKSSTRA